MPSVHFSFESIPPFEQAIRKSAPNHLVSAMRKAFHQIGKSDIDKLKTEQLSGGKLNIRSKGFRNSFKSKTNDAKTINQLTLREYTGAKPFQIFETGGTITPHKSRVLTVLTDAARTAGGKRKYSQLELRELINNKLARIIQTKAGPAIVLEAKTTKTGKLRRGAKMTILAWLRPNVTEDKRIDFIGNFERNSGLHNSFLESAAEECIERTIEDAERGGK